MTEDARFEDGAAAGALALRAETAEDLAVIAALVQDAVLPVAEIRHDPKRRQLALLVNRFRWEDRAAAEAERRPYERVRALLVLSDVTGLASRSIDRRAREGVLSLLSLTWEPGADGTGRVVLVFSGEAALSVGVECLAVDLRDVTRPYLAPSRRVPGHPE